MSLMRMTRRRRPARSADKPQLERIEHANLERPGARLHPRAGPAAPPPALSVALSAAPAGADRPQAPLASCKTERPGA